MRIGAYLTSVQAVIDAGGTVTQEYTDAVARWRAWNTPAGESASDRLAAAYRDGADLATLNTLRQEAIIAQSSTTVDLATVNNSVAPIAREHIMTAYKATAAANYETLRDKFNDAADRFHSKADVIDPDPGTLVSAPARTRTAWLEADLIARELDALAAPLADAATLAGHAVKTPADHAGLTMNAGDLHRRRVWEALNATGRCGKWSALVNLGATLNAPDLDSLTPYREARPIETVYEHTGFGMRPIELDPEDDDYDEKAANMRRATPGRVALI
jgi:hypothetical protein